ncbi:MAG: hypothetical protein CVT77_18135 [Alphaproteobacteria bacterium HGW-Alphaproteobacteria-16]|nr:MAG: hypothetical protein CVT77_18135 [Alphaproteobacteria bacterium HGW-Alphaproteobacteria-16]
MAGASGGLADNDTRWTAEVANAIVQEIVNVITHPDGGNTALNPADSNQLRAAILTMIAGAGSALGIRKRGTTSGTLGPGTYYQPFPEAFPTSCDVVVITGINSIGSAAKDVFPQLQSRTAAGFYYVIQTTSTGGDNTLNGISWIAEGQ